MTGQQSVRFLFDFALVGMGVLGIIVEPIMLSGDQGSYWFGRHWSCGIQTSWFFILGALKYTAWLAWRLNSTANSHSLAISASWYCLIFLDSWVVSPSSFACCSCDATDHHCLSRLLTTFSRRWNSFCKNLGGAFLSLTALGQGEPLRLGKLQIWKVQEKSLQKRWVIHSGTIGYDDMTYLSIRMLPVTHVTPRQYECYTCSAPFGAWSMACSHLAMPCCRPSLSSYWPCTSSHV